MTKGDYVNIELWPDPPGYTPGAVARRRAKQAGRQLFGDAHEITTDFLREASGMLGEGLQIITEAGIEGVRVMAEAGIGFVEGVRDMFVEP